MGFVMNEYDCGCRVEHDGGMVYTIEYCPIHKAAPAMYEALQEALKLLKADAPMALIRLQPIINALSKAEEK